jgi:DNA polymerase III alpha subunit
LDLETIKDDIKDNIVVAGIVVKSDIFTSKKNVRYHKFVLQDYDGEMDFFLSEKTLDMFSNIVSVNEFLLVKCAAVMNKHSGLYRIEIKNIHRMEYIKKNYFTGLNLNIDVNKIDLDKFDEIEQVIKQFSGDNNLEFNLFDKEKKYNVKTYSSENKINICEDLIHELDKLNVQYNIVIKN